MPSTGEDLFNIIFICYTLKHGYMPESMDKLYASCIYMYDRATCMVTLKLVLAHLEQERSRVMQLIVNFSKIN